MRSKMKLMIDMLMLIGMFFSMSFHCYGVGVHKILGLMTIVLFGIHCGMNRRWYRALKKGRYTPSRAARTAANLVITAAVLGMLVSGVMLSKEMASNAVEGAMTMGRALHLASSYVGCVGIAIHIGIHLKRRTRND